VIPAVIRSLQEQAIGLPATKCLEVTREIDLDLVRRRFGNSDPELDADIRCLVGRRWSTCERCKRGGHAEGHSSQ
jgi:hypothetical protein